MVTTVEWVTGVSASGVAVMLALAVVAARNRDVHGAVPFAWLSFAASGWAALELVAVLAADPAVAKTSYRLGEAVSLQTAMLWSLFALVYTGRREWLTTGRLLALWTPLSAYGVLRVTGPWHGLVGQSLTVETTGGITAPAPVRGPWLLGATVLAYAFVLAGFALLVGFFRDAQAPYRKQTGAVLVGSLFPTVGTVAFTVGLSPHPGVSLSPTMFAVNGLVTWYALFRYDFLSVAPVAKEVLIDELPEPVLVLDDEDVVREHNPAATRLLAGGLADRHVDAVADGLAARIRDGGRVTVEPDGAGATVYDLQVTEIEDRFGDSRGRLVVFRDVSSEQRRLDQLEALQATTQRFVGARTAGEVADTAVQFADDGLGHDHAVLFVHDPDTDVLEPVATTEAVAATVDLDQWVVPPGSGPFWEAFADDETRVVADTRDVVVGGERFPARTAALLSLGEHGLLAVGTDETEFDTAESQLLRILARTTETALTRIEHERQIRENRAALEQRNNQIEFFNGVLRHNVRNSMLVIDGHAEVLTDSVGEDADKLETIREWCSDLTELTEKVRAINDTLTRDEADRLGPVDVTAAIEDSAAWLRDRHEGVDVDLQVHDGVVVTANGLVDDVLETVLGNAVEHNDTDEPRVTVRTRQLGEWVQVEVADNGPGLSDEMKTQVFQRELGSSDTAHGFGLYFVSVMMDLYAGDVWFEDNDPRGTVVVLEFRLADEATLAPPRE